MWDANPDASVGGYFVFVGSSPRTYTSIIDVGTATSLSLTHLDPMQRHYVAVASYGRTGIAGDLSAELSWGQAPEPPALPNVEDVQPVNGTTPPALPNVEDIRPVNDTTPPVVTITTPSPWEPPPTNSQVVVVGGVASDDSAVTSIRWKNSRGESGQATGTEAWLAAIPLHSGRNELKISATDAAGNTAITVVVFNWP
jgi:hypothetical protein